MPHFKITFLTSLLPHAFLLLDRGKAGNRMLSQTTGKTWLTTLCRQSSGLYKFVHLGHTTYLSKLSLSIPRKFRKEYIVIGRRAAKERIKSAPAPFGIILPIQTTLSHYAGKDLGWKRSRLFLMPLMRHVWQKGKKEQLQK